MKEFNNCKELIEFLIETYDAPEYHLGNHFLGEKGIEIKACGCFYQFPKFVYSHNYEGVILVLQDMHELGATVRFTIIVGQGDLQENSWVEMPIEYIGELINVIGM